MFSFDDCYFCNQPLYKGSCVNEPCNSKYEFQVYPDLNLIDFYYNGHIFEYHFNKDMSAKSMLIIDRLEDKVIFSADYHIESKDKSFAKLLSKLNELKVLS